MCYNENECNPETGECECVGFTGEHCDEPCPRGTFGKGCAEKCDCEQEAYCHPTNGTCICPEGFKGEHCDQKSKS
ncbi:unnamed protein product [Gongylonema pulchrum]|uniref:Laminin EGF-like domain-containing protein n=1 Tax=Gongylonema pulchrum TaxID=637853 RepID=A0A183EE38_9BILA|nr:unnamed protein product [Gongylonema pulchrum]